MIGLEYILQISGINHNDLANDLGITKQNINLWIKGKQMIPKKHLNLLSTIFKQSEEIFQKVLNHKDKILILENEIIRLKN
jgi:plasmid maintenance system antidote protein VapI